MKVPLRSINYKHYKWYIESDQIFPLRFVVKFGGIRETLLVTRLALVFKNLSSNLFCQRDQRHIGQSHRSVSEGGHLIICSTGGEGNVLKEGKMDNAYFSQLLGMASEKQKAKTATSGSSSKFMSTKVFWPLILFILLRTSPDASKR